MAWIERVDKRHRRTKTWQDTSRLGKFATDGVIAPVHYESEIDSGVYDASIDCTPQRVTTLSFDGWRITDNGWQYALGKDLANHGDQDGWVGFGGRKGQNWFKFRLARVGYLHWNTRTWQDVGGAPTYNRANLTSEVGTVTFPTDGSQQVIGSVARWANLWVTPGGGSLSASWSANGDGLKEEITINQAARTWVTANRPPTTKPAETFFGFVFQLDWSDIPQIVRQNILQEIDGDFADDGEAIELRDTLDRLLAFMPISDLYIPNDNPLVEQVRRSLRKRFYKDGENYYLLLGIRCDTLASLPAGDLVFDPTIDAQTAAGGDDFAHKSTSTFSSSNTTDGVGYTNYHVGARWAGLTVSGTVDAAYISYYAHDSADGSPYLTVYGVDQDNPAAPTSSAEWLADPLTTAAVDWDGGWTKNAWNNSPSLTSIIQELVDSYTISSDAIMIYTKCRTGAGFNLARQYERTTVGEWGAKIHIEYTEAAAAIEGSLSKTLGAATLSGAGEVDIEGVLSVTLGAITSSASGGVSVVGSLSSTLGAVTGAATGTVDIQGELTKTLGGVTISSAGTVTIAGQAGITLDAVTGAAAGEVDIAGEGTPTLGAVTSSAAGTVSVTGEADITIGAVTSSAAGGVAIVGTLDITLGGVTLAAVGGAGTTGSLSSTLGAVTSDATGEVDIAGELAKSLGAVTTTGTGQVEVQGELSKTLGAITGAAAGTVAISGVLSSTLGGITLTATAEVVTTSTEGQASITLGAITSTAAGRVAIVGALSSTLGAVVLSAAGQAGVPTPITVKARTFSFTPLDGRYLSMTPESRSIIIISVEGRRLSITPDERYTTITAPEV